jgi:class 3 adenylate cyclase
VSVIRARIDRHRCIGAGNCITIAPTAFGWVKGDLLKAAVVDAESVEEELLREAAASCPTDAIEIEEVEELLPWQLRGKTGPERRVLKTFMFTDIVKSTNLAEAMGDSAWSELLRWHDETLRYYFAAHSGDEVSSTGDGFFVGFDSPDAAVSCAVAIQRRLADHRRQHGFAPHVRIGLHASGAAQVGRSFRGKGVHEAARIADLGEGGEIVASVATVGDASSYRVSEPRTVTLKGLSEPVDVVSIDWR